MSNAPAELHRIADAIRFAVERLYGLRFSIPAGGSGTEQRYPSLTARPLDVETATIEDEAADQTRLLATWARGGHKRQGIFGRCKCNGLCMPCRVSGGGGRRGTACE